MDRSDVERLGSEGVGEMDTERGAADGEVNDLADGGIAEVVWWQGILWFGDLLRGSPGGHPRLWFDRSGLDGSRGRECRNDCGEN